MGNDELRRYELQLASAEAEAAAAISRVDALRKIVEGLRYLQKPPRQAERLFPESPELEIEDDTADQPVDGPAASYGFPRGRAAVRGVLIDSRRAWKIPALAAEIERRGWMPDVKNTRDAVAATVQRLVRDEEAERVGHGVYRYRLDKLPPLAEALPLTDRQEVAQR
jgi:hypothetical protein